MNLELVGREGGTVHEVLTLGLSVSVRFHFEEFFLMHPARVGLDGFFLVRVAPWGSWIVSSVVEPVVLRLNSRFGRTRPVIRGSDQHASRITLNLGVLAVIGDEAGMWRGCRCVWVDGSVMIRESHRRDGLVVAVMYSWRWAS